jgi:hypothetical protein
MSQPLSCVLVVPVTTLVRGVARGGGFAAPGEEPTVVREDIARLAAH